jgi:RHS repeat-associated protein
LTLTGTNAYSGGTTISAGTLYVGNYTSTGTLGSGAVVDNAALVFNRSGTATIANAISGTGTVTQTAGTLILTGANTYSGGTTINDGTLQVGAGGTSGTLGSGDVTGGYFYGELVFDRSDSVTVDNDISGSISLVQQGSGTLTLTGSNTYSDGTTVSDGTLCVGDGATAGTLGSGSVTVDYGGLLVFDRSDTVTINEPITGEGDLSQEGSGTLVLTDENSLGSATIDGGTLRVEGSLTLSDSFANLGTLGVVGTGFVTYGSTRIAGTAAALSAGEVMLDSTGLGIGSSSLTFEVSADGVNYYPIAYGETTDTQTLLSGLQPNTDYYLRSRATYLVEGQERYAYYDGGMVTTAQGPGPGAPDTAGWYRVVAIAANAGGYLTPNPGSTAYRRAEALPETTEQMLSPRDSQVYVFGDTGWTGYGRAEALPETTEHMRSLSDSHVQVFQDTGSPPLGSDNIFTFDHSWFFAESPQAAILQAVVGLVYDQSVPTVTGGVVTVWHVRGEIEEDEYDLWTFDVDKYHDTCPSAYYFIIDSLDPGTLCDPTCDCGGGETAGGTCGLPSKWGSAILPMPKIDSTDGAPACNVAKGGLTYSSRELSLDTGFGPGWSDADELPYLMGGEQNMVARFGAEQTVWFDAQEDGSYTARYGVQDTLVHDSENDLFILTRPDGTRYEFFDTDQTDHPQGGFYRSVRPGGATTEVTYWTESGVDGRIAEVVDKTTPTGQAYQKRDFTYTTTEDGIQHVETQWVMAYNEGTSTWTNVRLMIYGYYGASYGASYGLPGDLKTIVTQQWDAVAEDWTGDDTNYFRYYTGTTTAHELKRVLLPNAYAAFVAAYGNPDDPYNSNAGDTQSDPIANYTCFYYEYDADRRVTNRVVFGKSNETDYTVTLSTNSRTFNNWNRKTVETRLDGSTNTVYANHIGQAILTDLRDSSGNHWVTYNRYDSDGRLVLTAEPSAFVPQSGEYYDEDLADLIDYADGDSPYLSDTAGLFRISTYYASTSEGIDEDTAGGVEGFGHQTAVAHGEDAARTAIGQSGGPILLSTSDYYARTVGDVTINPVASQTTYANEDGTGAITTDYAYTWYSGSFQIQEETTTLPEVSTGQNGSGTSAASKQWFDDDGNLAWTMDQLGRATYHEYDSLTGRLAETIADIDDATADELELDIPTGWTLPASGGANATTDYEHDAFGRVTQTLGPAHTAEGGTGSASVRTATWTFYNDATHETRSAQGYVVVSTSATVILGPVSITKTDRDGRTTERIQATYSGDLDDLATATISQSDYTAWTTYQYSKTRLVSTRAYDDIPTSGTGTSGTNYDQTSYGYESFGTSRMGRQNRAVGADGTITRRVFDARGNVVSTWIGTGDTGATDTDPTGGSAQGNNMLKVSSSTFDPDGNLSESRAYFGSGANDYYATLYQYDWHDRRTDIRSPLLAGEGQGEGIVTHYEYDNLGQATWTKTYASADFTLSSGELRAQTNNLYDALGRVYESRVYEVDPDDGTVGDYLPSETWYGARGQVVKAAAANGLFQKLAYDGLGRTVASYTCYDTDETAYSDADDVTGDTVIEQSQTWYDQAGQVIATATYRRLPDDTSTTGVLTAANSYATAAVSWYDGAGRVVASVDYGREDVDSGLTHYFFNGTTGALIDTDSDNIPDVAEAAPPEPDSSDNYIVALTEYDAAGRAYRSIDNLDRITETQYDDAGRVVKTIQNYDDGTVEETDTDCDSTVDYEYDSGGRLVTMTAYNAKGSSNGVQSQATKYLYQSQINASWQTAVVYPDSTDVLSQNQTTSVWSITTDNGDHVSASYDRLGRTTTKTDQRGVEHTYVYDSAGRLAHDRVTDLGESAIVDDAILRISTSYDDVGRVQTVTSCDDADVGEGNVVNQIEYVYDGWGQVAREYQEHDGAVDQYTPYVDYGYEDGATGGVAKYVRLSQVTYPNGREVQYGYGAAQATDDIMSRLATIGDGTDTYASYQYLGAGRIVVEDYEDIEVKLDYAADEFAALDRFGRVLDQVWTDYGADPDVTLDEYTYTYDRAGARASRTNELNGDLSETYEFDDLDRLIAWDIDGVEQETWEYDSLGNDLASGTYNAANEETPDQGSSGYDDTGNMTTLKSGDTAVYDAWSRLVEVHDGETIVERHEYDGAGRRTQLFSNFDGSTPGKVVDDYLVGQQTIESDVTVDGDRDGGYQTTWSRRYIDAPILRDTLNTAGTGIVTAERVFYLADANYNVTGLVKYDSGDDEWEVVERYTYTPYGLVTYRNPDWTTAGSSANSNTTLYTGRTLDPLTSLYYYRARYDDPVLERFVTRDTLQHSPNLYEYCSDNPLTRTDPTGQTDTIAGDALQKLCTDKCVANVGSGCSKEQCEKEAADIGAAYTKAVNENKAIEWLRPIRSGAYLVTRCGVLCPFLRPSDRRAGWMCYQWQAITYDALKDLINNSKCFSEARVGYVGGSGTLYHNWVAITVGGKGQGGTGTSTAGPCTAWADPWTGGGWPAIYLFDPKTGTYDRPGLNSPGDANFVVDERWSEPKCVEGWYLDKTGSWRQRRYKR